MCLTIAIMGSDIIWRRNDFLGCDIFWWRIAIFDYDIIL